MVDADNCLYDSARMHKSGVLSRKGQTYQVNTNPDITLDVTPTIFYWWRESDTRQKSRGPHTFGLQQQ